MPKENYRQHLEQLKRMTKKTQRKNTPARNVNLQKLIEELEEENQTLKALARDQKTIIDKLHGQIKGAISLLQQ